MTEEPIGRPGQPGRPHRFYFDDLADEPESAAPNRTETDVDDHFDDHFDDMVDTGPIQVIRDPVPGSAAQQLHLDDLVDDDEVSEPEPVEEPAGQLYFDDLDEVDDAVEAEPAGHVPPPWETDNRPAALAPAGGRRRPRPIGAVLALIAVLALVGVIAAISSGGGHSRDAAQVGKPKASAPAATGPATDAPKPSNSAAHSSAPAHSTAPGHRKTPAVPTTAPAGIPLTVLNNTTESGLAKTAAQAFSTKGWQVGQVGNYTGQISVTTVYYNPSDPAQHQAAETLARQYPGVAQVQPRFADLPGTGLTVVLAPGWHL